MAAGTKTAKFLVVSALLYLAVLGVTGELHLSSRAFVFFSILWLVQATAELWQWWRHSDVVASVSTTTDDEIPPPANVR
jgi:hypothetical protein